MSLPRFTFTSRAAPFIELGTGDTRVDVGVARWDVAHWDNAADASWSGSEPLWVDQTCHGYTIELQAGRQRNTDAFAPATATITLENLDGWADATLLTLRPGRSLRVGVDHVTLGRRVLFRGIVDAVVPSYMPGGADTVEIQAVCALGDVGRVELADVAAPGVGAGEFAHVRVARILNAAKWPAGKRDLDVSGVTCLATRLGQQVADMFTIISESTGGAVYGDTEGRVVFRGRDWQMFYPADLPDATIGNFSDTIIETELVEDPAGSGLYTVPGEAVEDPAGSGLYTVPADMVEYPTGSGLYLAGVVVFEICPSEWQLAHRRDDMVTQVILGRDQVDAVQWVYDDVTGQTMYGIETFEAADLVCATKANLDTIAARQFRVRGGANSKQRVERVLIDTATDPDAVDLAASVTVFDQPSRLRCRLILARGLVFDDEMFATGVRHTMTPDAWTCDIDLDDAAPFATWAARWDDNNGWDLTTWAEAARELGEVA